MSDKHSNHPGSSALKIALLATNLNQALGLAASLSWTSGKVSFPSLWSLYIFNSLTWLASLARIWLSRPDADFKQGEDVGPICRDCPTREIAIFSFQKLGMVTKKKR